MFFGGLYARRLASVDVQGPSEATPANRKGETGRERPERAKPGGAGPQGRPARIGTARARISRLPLTLIARRPRMSALTLLVCGVPQTRRAADGVGGTELEKLQTAGGAV